MGEAPGELGDPQDVKPTDDCALADNFMRDCCNENPLKVCRVSAGVSTLVFLFSLSISVYLYTNRQRVHKETFNLLLHVVINLALLCNTAIHILMVFLFSARVALFLDETLYKLNI
jgi:hypothetical protein